MTAQSDNDKYSRTLEPHRDDDHLLKDLVFDSRAEGTIEGIVESPGACEAGEDQGSGPAGSVNPASANIEVAGAAKLEVEVDNLPKPKSGQADNLAKRDRPVSLWRDAAFLRNLEGFLASQALPSEDVTSVISSTLLSPLTCHPLTKLAVSAGRAGKQGKSPRKPGASWWHVLLAKSARQYRVPAAWRDTSFQLKVLYRHLALREFGEVHSFTLNLRPDIEALALTQSNPAGWFHDRLVRYLKSELGRSPEFHFVVEEADLAGGEWDKVRQHQAHTDVDPDQGWASYISKDLWKIRFTRDFLPQYGNPRSSYAIAFSGNPFSTTFLLGRKAAVLFKEHRELLVQAQRAKHNGRRRRSGRTFKPETH
jgi:hypothetical protein